MEKLFIIIKYIFLIIMRKTIKCKRLRYNFLYLSKLFQVGADSALKIGIRA